MTLNTLCLKAYPDIFLWTTYPLTTLLKYFHQKKTRMAADAMADAPMVELCAAVERALNYMHTGHGKAITTTLMNPLWLGRAVIEDGLPCINPVFFQIQDGMRFRFALEKWPMDGHKLIPASASKAVQVMNYGETQFNVSWFYFLSDGTEWKGSWAATLGYQSGGVL